MAETSTDDSSGLSPSNESAKVVVVGAGFAGVTAAAKLIQNGIKDVIVLEAQDYVGGRVVYQMVDNKQLDMGAMFIHGREGNPMYDIAKRVTHVFEDGNDEDLVNRPESFYTSKREKVPFREVKDLIDFVENLIEDMDTENMTEGVSKGDVISGYYKQYLQSHNGLIDRPKQELFDAAFMWYCFYENINEASDTLKDLSAWASEEYTGFEGNRYTRVKGGYSKILQAITDLIPEGVIRTGMPVTIVDWTDADDENILVKYGNGKVVSTSHVILTSSISCIKATHSAMFHPTLPSPFIKSVQSLNCGATGKIFLKWDFPFWNTELISYEFLWLESHPVTIKQDKCTRKTRLMKPWWQDIAGFETVTEHENILLLWLLPHQVEVVNELNDEEVMAVLHELMQHFFFDMQVPKPTCIYRTRWLENPYTRGSYTHATLSFQRCDKEHLTQPIPSIQNPRLSFAGEGYSLDHLGTTHSAYITGEQQAENILHANGITNTISVVNAVALKH